MADDIAKLMIEIDATTSLLRTQLSQAERGVSKFAKQANADLKKVDAGFDKAGKNAARLMACLAPIAVRCFNGQSDASPVMVRT